MIRRLILATLLLLAGARLSAAEVLHLADPPNRAVLRGGEAATLAWSAEHLPPDAEEWEAFLSIDGGHYYAFRVTPHLDVDRTDVTWVVPNVDATDVRLMIRTGDEKHESTFELPESFSIVRDPHAELPLLTALSPARPEAARIGDPDVVARADGDRSGDDITLHYAEPASSPSALVVVFDSRESVLMVRPVGVRAAFAARANLRDATRAPRAFAAGRQEFPPADLLLVCRRRNI